MTLAPVALHISTGSMDAHTQLLFYGLCFGPLVILAVVAYPQQRRIRREVAEDLQKSQARDHAVSAGLGLEPRLPRPRRAAPRRTAEGDHGDQQPGRATDVPPPS
jgi:hypothetical protein